MVRQIFAAGAALAVLSAMQPALAAAPSASSAPAAAPAYTTATSSIGDLLDNPATKAILVKHLPDLVNNPQLDMARGMTLKQIQSYSADSVTDEVLARIDADLAKLPAK
ncbi:hypothetical protein WBP07_30440 [Novosphingobium sp. BL-8A]